MFAQEATDIATDLVGTFTPIVLLLSPFIIGLAVNFTTEENAKKGLAAFLGVFIAGVMIYLDPPASLSLPIIMARLSQAYPIVELGYRMWNLILKPISGKRLNELSAPGIGIKIGEASKAGQAAYDDIRDR